MLTATQGSGEKASTSSYTYDSVGNVTSVTNGNGKVTSYSYDQLSNLVERMTSLGDKETYTYNVNNQLEKVTKSDGKTISYDYNKLDQLLKVEYSEKQDGQVLYTYDADGRRVSMSDLTGTSQYATNEEGEITGVRQGDGSLIQYEYDAYGNISKMIYPDGSTVSYTYDELDRLTSVTDVKGQKTSYSYNTAGDLTDVVRGDGTKSFLTYDKAHRLTELRHMDKQDKLISSYGYEYDDGGYIAKETIKQDGETLVHTYTYDTLGQVENMTVSDGAGKELSKLSYTYDLAGNKLTSTETVDGKESQTRFTYDDHNRLTKLEGPDGTITYTYDKNGNRIASEKNSEKLDYIYDTENRLLAIKDKKGLLMAALYDGDDNRVFTASRKEGKNTYQLFQRKPKDTKSGRKSPYTAPSGEENSLFWYGFSQNVLQALSTLPQTVGSIWHSIFDDVSRAYHQKVAKDRASKEGIVVNPPELGNLPGQGEVTYASQVQDVLIPYTTREDTYNYYEERNYVNDVNREHTEVLETYDHDGKARETYSYGKGRASYLNNQTGDSYNYLTNQSGSVTGLTKDGQAVASSSYNLYGARKTSTDTTGNPFAYNGEARDDTGLDYLRARYYDSQGGTFLTEDSYPGEETDPLSQNRYSYVQNNPVNYTDPSGHFWNSIKKGWNYVKSGLNWAGRQISRGVNWVGRQISRGANWVGRQIDRGVNWVSTQYNRAVNWGSRQWNKVQTAYNSAVDYVQTKYHQAQARIQELRYQAIRTAYTLATGLTSSPTIREGKNLLRNWNPALLNTLKHVCDPKTTKALDKAGNKVNSVDDYSVSAYEFKQNLKKQYGFDEEISDLLWKLYKNIEKKEGRNTGYVYNRIVGGVKYNDEYLKGLQWNLTAGIIGDIRSELDKYGIKDSQAEKLIYNIRIQYYMSSGTYGDTDSLKKQGRYNSFKSTASEVYSDVDFDTLWNGNYSKYSGKTDFAHQSITTATHLYDKPVPADIYGIFMGGTSALAGWRGDVTKDAEAKPSLGNDDYKADLDTVNITSIMQKNKVDYISASNLYYDGISSGSYTRANAFKENVSLDYVKKAVYKSLVPGKTIALGPNKQSYSRRTDAESMEYLKKNYPDSYNFIRSLEEGKNDLQDYTNVP